MKKNLLTTLLFMLVFALTQASVNAAGLFYTDATYPVTATGVKVDNLNNLKKGSASTTNILYIVEVGDASTDTAAKNAGIKKISYIDINVKSIFIFWAKTTVNVYGEE